MTTTLFRYLARSYLAYFGFGLSIIASALLISNVFDTLSRFRSTAFESSLFLALISFKLPYLLLEILPLVCFLSALFFFRNLIKSGEFVAILNSGTSIWAILFPIALTAACIGIISVAIFSPVSSTLLLNYEKITSKLEKRSNNTTITGLGIMVAENYNNEERIFIAKAIELGANKISGLTVLFTDENNNFIRRIDTTSAFLENELIELHNGRMLLQDTAQTIEAPHVIPTHLTTAHFAANPLAPEYISFWQLPKMMRTIQKAGMSISRYEMCYYKQLFKPLMMVATILMAACFIKINDGRKSVMKLLVIGVISGFMMYLFSEVSMSMLTYHGVRPSFAILSSILAIMIFSIYTILHLHEAG